MGGLLAQLKPTRGTRSPAGCTSDSARRHPSASTSSGGLGGSRLRDDGEPGPRPIYGSDYYGGFLLDPDGNSVEAVHFEDIRDRRVDHLWIRWPTSRRRSASTRRSLRTRISGWVPTRPSGCSFNGDAGSFSVLTGDHLTENLHMAFPASDNEAVEDFHQAALEAGYRDNGRPGERPDYHAGLLRRLRARPRRQQHRAGEPQPLSPWRRAARLARPRATRRPGVRCAAAGRPLRTPGARSPGMRRSSSPGSAWPASP